MNIFNPGDNFHIPRDAPPFPNGITQEQIINQLKTMGTYVTTNHKGEECYVFQNLLFKINKKGEVLGTVLET